MSVTPSWVLPDRKYQIHTGKFSFHWPPFLINSSQFSTNSPKALHFIYLFIFSFLIRAVLQFVPGHVDVRFCNFSESIEKGLTLAFAEVRRRSKESTNFTVNVSVTRMGCN